MLVVAFIERPGVTAALEYLAEAVADAEGATRWYAERSPAAARRFSEELDAAEEAIAAHPEAWPAYQHGARHYLLRRYPFSVVYRIEPERVLVVAVMHHRRRPGYWRQRG
jgi:toxin ParE1/3/4